MEKFGSGINIPDQKNWVPKPLVENKFFPTMPMDERLDQLAAIQLVIPVGVVHLNEHGESLIIRSSLR
jgi:hypothetical protein